MGLDREGAVGEEQGNHMKSKLLTAQPRDRVQQREGGEKKQKLSHTKRSSPGCPHSELVFLLLMWKCPLVPHTPQKWQMDGEGHLKLCACPESHLTEMQVMFEQFFNMRKLVLIQNAGHFVFLLAHLSLSIIVQSDPSVGITNFP